VIGGRVLLLVGVAAAALFAHGSAAQTTQRSTSSPAARRQFVACPIVRDTKTQPCWLAEYGGELYYLGQQGGVANDFYPPQLGHQVLVEGTVGTGRVCGGIPLQPIKVSVLKELSPSCNTILPAEDGIEAPPPIPAPRGPAPSWVRVANPGNVTLYFDFDNDFFSLHVTVALTDLAAHIMATKASRVEVVGYRAATRLSDRQVLTERAQIGAVRARKVADTLEGLGVARSILVVSAPEKPERADGINDPWNRRVDIHIR
jgi:outer membrane protein OmpA-like peptidoglycan-associated protein